MTLWNNSGVRQGFVGYSRLHIGSESYCLGRAGVRDPLGSCDKQKDKLNLGWQSHILVLTVHPVEGYQWGPRESYLTAGEAKAPDLQTWREGPWGEGQLIKRESVPSRPMKHPTRGEACA